MRNDKANIIKQKAIEIYRKEYDNIFRKIQMEFKN